MTLSERITQERRQINNMRAAIAAMLAEIREMQGA